MEIEMCNKILKNTIYIYIHIYIIYHKKHNTNKNFNFYNISANTNILFF